MLRKLIYLVFAAVLSSCTNTLDLIDFSQVNSSTDENVTIDYEALQFVSIRNQQNASESRQIVFRLKNQTSFELCVPKYHSGSVFGRIDYFNSKGESLQMVSGSESPEYSVPLGNPIASQQIELHVLRAAESLEITRRIQAGMFRRYPDGFEQYEVFQENGPYFVELTIEGIVICPVEGFSNPMDSRNYQMLVAKQSFTFYSERSSAFYLSE